MEPRLRLQSYASPAKTFKGWRILSLSLSLSTDRAKVTQ